MTKEDFAFQAGGFTMMLVGIVLVLVGYLKLGSSATTSFVDILNTFFVTLFLGPFLIIWGTMILGIGWIAEASRRVPETKEDAEKEESKERSQQR